MGRLMDSKWGDCGGALGRRVENSVDGSSAGIEY